MATTVPWLDALRRTHIIEPIDRDPREAGQHGMRLGVDSDWIFRHAVGGGQASFDEPVGPFSSRDRVMLYALLLQKGHVGELVHAFGRMLDDPNHLNGATVLDIGCGPFTSGLALAHVGGADAAFRYFGVDTSVSMCTLGAELAQGAKDVGGLSQQALVEFRSSSDAIDFGAARGGWTIVILSYLLASPTIDVVVLARQIVDACNRIGPGPAAVLYTNTTRPGAGTTFPAFRDSLLGAGFTLHIEEREALTVDGRQRNIHYALFHRVVPPPIPLTAFQR
jgi:SAM-dependent methyltransferase